MTAGVTEQSRYDNLTVHAPDGTALFSDDFSVAPDPSFPHTDGHRRPVGADAGDPTLLDRNAGAPMLRTTFTLDRKVAQARAYVFGLGLYEMHLNGAKVGDAGADPRELPLRPARPVRHL